MFVKYIENTYCKIKFIKVKTMNNQNIIQIIYDKIFINIKTKRYMIDYI